MISALGRFTPHYPIAQIPPPLDPVTDQILDFDGEGNFDLEDNDLYGMVTTNEDEISYNSFALSNGAPNFAITIDFTKSEDYERAHITSDVEVSRHPKYAGFGEPLISISLEDNEMVILTYTGEKQVVANKVVMIRSTPLQPAEIQV